MNWKTANITPIHKKGPTNIANNYRPISLTCISCKVLEHIVLKNLNAKLDNVLHHRQHGFRRGLSCETQLCSTMHDIYTAVDNSNTVHAVVMDFTKAFDRVPHALLMSKLSKVPDIDDYLLRWIHDFLTNRIQQVVLDAKSSESLPVSSGVPQGSVLGPTLFLLYINDLPDVIDCNISLFADDTLLFQIVNNLDDENRMQNNINKVRAWADHWKMDFNVAKCSIMVFNGKGTTPKYKLGSEILEHVEQTKYLGVTIESNLKFSSHIANKINTAKWHLGLIKRGLHWAPKSAKLLAYKSLCRPHLEYASALWDPHTKSDTYKLELVQNQAIRFVNNIKGREGVTEARKKLKLHTLEKRRRDQRIKLLMRILVKEEKHSALQSSYEELINQQPSFIQTRAQSRGLPPSVSANRSLFHNSFLPRTIRDIKENY